MPKKDQTLCFSQITKNLKECRIQQVTPNLKSSLEIFFYHEPACRFSTLCAVNAAVVLPWEESCCSSSKQKKVEFRRGGSFFSPSFSVSCHLLPNYRICVKIPLLSNQFGMRPIIVARIPNNFYPTAFSRAKNRQIFFLFFCCTEICIRWGTD